ncbi:MAG: DNA-3-methyladenine glycosylase [Candidatus Saccharimonadales bacterium]
MQRPQLQIAADWLAANDPVLSSIIVGQSLPNFQPHQDYYGALVSSIVGQQLSVKAAATIKQRLRDQFGDQLPTPEEIINTPHDQLRACGLSNAKANYIRDLAEHLIDKRISFVQLDKLSNDEIIALLTDVKGIGQWTVHMFLMFCVGRMDVLAVGDLGVRSAIRTLYRTEALPTPSTITELATDNHWHPYESVACWYLWRSLDNAPKIN